MQILIMATLKGTALLAELLSYQYCIIQITTHSIATHHVIVTMIAHMRIADTQTTLSLGLACALSFSQPLPHIASMVVAKQTL